MKRTNHPEMEVQVKRAFERNFLSSHQKHDTKVNRPCMIFFTITNTCVQQVQASLKCNNHLNYNSASVQFPISKSRQSRYYVHPNLQRISQLPSQSQ